MASLARRARLGPSRAYGVNGTGSCKPWASVLLRPTEAATPHPPSRLVVPGDRWCAQGPTGRSAHHASARRCFRPATGPSHARRGGMTTKCVVWAGVRAKHLYIVVLLGGAIAACGNGGSPSASGDAGSGVAEAEAPWPTVTAASLPAPPISPSASKIAAAPGVSRVEPGSLDGACPPGTLNVCCGKPGASAADSDCYCGREAKCPRPAPAKPPAPLCPAGRMFVCCGDAGVAVATSDTCYCGTLPICPPPASERNFIVSHPRSPRRARP